MGFLDMFKQTGMNDGVEQYRQTKDAVLLDVRSAEEYKEGHVPGSTNLDVECIQNAPSVIPEKETPLFVYCRSGARSSRAVSALKHMGYTNVMGIGGIMEYEGPMEK